MQLKKRVFYFPVLLLAIAQLANAQFHPATQWTPDGSGLYQKREGDIVKMTIRTGTETIAISKSQLTTSTGKVLDPAAFVLVKTIANCWCLPIPPKFGAIKQGVITGYWTFLQASSHSWERISHPNR